MNISFYMSATAATVEILSLLLLTASFLFFSSCILANFAVDTSSESLTKRRRSRAYVTSSSPVFFATSPEPPPAGRDWFRQKQFHKKFLPQSEKPYFFARDFTLD